jgi:hypothetical protein
MQKLLNIGEVADLLRMSARAVKRLPIHYSRMGRLRRYDLRDVEAYRLESLECPSTSAKARRTSTQKSKSEGIGLFEALKQHPAGRRKRSTAITERKSLSEPESLSRRP